MSNPAPYPRPSAVLQPVIDLRTGALVGAEALARFPKHPEVQVAQLFAQQHLDAVALRLQAASLRAALRRRESLPPGLILGINIHPEALGEPSVMREFGPDLSGVLVEVTEQAIAEPAGLRPVLTELRQRGALLAIDDTGAEYAGLRRIVELRPDVVKLDRQLVSGQLGRAEQRVLIAAIVDICRQLGARVLGEGVETADDLIRLAELDVDYAQGLAIAAPAPVLPTVPDTVVERCRRARAGVLGTGPQPLTVGGATAELGRARDPADVEGVLRKAPEVLGVDMVTVSLLGGGSLPVDDAPGREGDVAALPAARSALEEGTAVEVHLADTGGDPAERDRLADLGYASLLLLPLADEAPPLGVLELLCREPRLWTRRDITRARTFAAHLDATLRRLVSG